MKKKLWLLFLISICLVIGIYFLVINNQSDWELHRVDGIPTATQTASNTTDKTVQTDKPAPEQSSGSFETVNIEQPTPSNTPELNNQDMKQPLPTTGNIPGNTMSNISAGGVLTTDGEWEYDAISDIAYINNKLFKIRINGSECIQLTDHNVGYINVVEDWIYYIKWNDDFESEGIFRIKKDGLHEEQLFNGDSRDMVILGNSIFFINATDGNKIYTMKTDGSDIKEFYNKKISRLQHDNNNLFFISIGNLYRLGLSENDLEELEQNVWHYIIYKESVYYQKYDDSRLYKKSIGESVSKVISNKINTPSFFIENDRIFFMTGITENENIYTMNLEGENIEIFFNGGVENPVRSIYGVVGESVYFWIMRDPYGSGDDELARINSDGSVTLVRDILPY